MPTISVLIRKAVVACIFVRVLIGQAEAYVAPSTESSEEILFSIQHSIQTGDFQKARIEIWDAFKAFPDDPRLYNFLGVIDAQQENFGAAEIDFQRAIRVAPGFIGAYMNLGRLYQTESVKHTGYYEKALDVYSKVSELEPGNTEARYQAALLLNRLGRFDSSLRQLSQLPAQEQRRAAALSLRCADEAGLQHKDSANTSGMELLRAPDLTEADVLPIIPELVKDHQAELATMLLESLVNRGSGSAAVMDQLAALYEGQQRFADSRQMLTRELQTTGQPSAALLTHLAKVAYKAGDLEGTLGYLAHARDLEPGNAAIHFLFGLVCIDLKLPPEAEDSLKEAVRLDPWNPNYSYALGAVQLQRRNPDGAIRHFKIFRDAEQQDPRGSFALGVAYFDAEQMEAARKELESAARHSQTRAGALLYLGRLALREQHVVEAADDLERAIQANPAIPQAYVELAGVQIRTKEYQTAEQNLSRALRLAPDDYQANLNLLLLYKRTNDARAEEQSRRLAALRQATEEREQMLLRSLDIHLY
jgi:tetratricopeptide (TPR) repeat protein